MLINEHYYLVIIVMKHKKHAPFTTAKKPEAPSAQSHPDGSTGSDNMDIDLTTEGNTTQPATSMCP